MSRKGGFLFGQGFSAAMSTALAGAFQSRQSRVTASETGDTISRKGAIVPAKRSVRDMMQLPHQSVPVPEPYAIAPQAGTDFSGEGMVGDDGLEPPTFSV